jgi:hypothetical protein
MSKLSRRSLVAHATALPALAVPAVAIAAIAEPDPVYTAIEAHRKAYTAWMKALNRWSEKEETPPDACVYLGDREKTTTTWQEVGNTYIGTKHRTGEREAVYARYEQEIKDFPPKSWSDAEREAWIKEKREELHAEQKRLDDEFAKTPEGRIWAVSEEFARKHNEAEANLFNATATTVQGLLALLTYIRTDDYLCNTIQAANEPGLNLAALFDRSLCRIADRPEPPPWFDTEETEEA